MVQITNLNIEIEGLKILAIDNYFDLTTAKSIYQCSPTDGGIKITPTLSIQGVSTGYFYITQICPKHSLKILTKNNNEYHFEVKDEILNDTPSTAQCHFKWYKIIDNSITDFASNSNKVIFFDAPFKELFHWWQEVNYDIEFETWFQYSSSPQLNIDIKPILKFNWGLNCKTIKQNDQWIIAKSTHSPIESILASVQYLTSNDKALSPCHLNHLGETVREFSFAHDELKKNYCR